MSVSHLGNFCNKPDCAILATVNDIAAFTTAPLFDEPLILALPEHHPWAERDALKLNELANTPLILLDDGDGLREHLMAAGIDAESKDIPHIRATGVEMVRNMVAAGSGIGLLPGLAVPPQKYRDGVCYQPCITPALKQTIVFAYRPGSPLQLRYEQLAEILRQTLNQAPNGLLTEGIDTHTHFGGRPTRARRTKNETFAR